MLKTMNNCHNSIPPRAYSLAGKMKSSENHGQWDLQKETCKATVLKEGLNM